MIARQAIFWGSLATDTSGEFSGSASVPAEVLARQSKTYAEVVLPSRHQANKQPIVNSPPVTQPQADIRLYGPLCAHRGHSAAPSPLAIAALRLGEEQAQSSIIHDERDRPTIASVGGSANRQASLLRRSAHFCVSCGLAFRRDAWKLNVRKAGSRFAECKRCISE